MPDTNISEEHHRAFEALTSGRFDNFCLVSCFVDGEATAAIAAVTVNPPLKTVVNRNISSARFSSARRRR